MQDFLLAHKKITSNFIVSDFYNLLDEFYFDTFNSKNLTEDDDFDADKDNADKDNADEDNASFVKSENLWFILRSSFYGATISHEENYTMILSDLPKRLDNELNSKLELKLSEKNAKDALQFVINLLPSLVAYNDKTTMINFISILRCLEVQTNIFKRFEFIYTSSRSLEHLHPVSDLKFGLSTDQVL
jgi:hypothetical protein